jgi:hypothetical protein
VALMAARLLDYTLDERWQQVRRRYLATEEEYAPEWRRAAGSDRAVLYLTPDELAGLRAQIRELYLPLVRMAGQDRPAGSEPVQAGVEFFPMFGPAERSGS